MHSLKRLPLTRYLEIFSYWLRNRLSGSETYPFYASFKITSRCHFRCPFCDIWRNPAPDLSLEDILKILENLGRSSILLVSLEGGEPLMRKDIGAILEFSSRQPFYVMLTTSQLNLKDYPMAEYGRLIDFLHISIDEGHRNLEMFDELPLYRRWGPEVSVQTVVTGQTLEALEWKVRRCHEAGVTMVVMPAVELEERGNFYPDPVLFRRVLLRLKRTYPGTILTTNGFLDNINRDHGCSTSSIIIRSDGALYYPCRILGNTIGNLVESSLNELLTGEEAERGRRIMAKCTRRCGWYQYFAIRSYTAPGEAVPLLLQHLRRTHQ